MADKMTEKDAREAALTARGLFDVTEDDSVYHLAKREFEAGWHSARQFYQPKWVRIDGPEDLPKEEGFYLVSRKEKEFHTDPQAIAEFRLNNDIFELGWIHTYDAWQKIEGYQPEEKQP